MQKLTFIACMLQVADGVEPNEHGTWLYGRNGWCDGQDVKPVLADVTADLKLPSSGLNVIEYKGLYQGQEPHPQYRPGYIMQTSTLSFFGASKSVKLQQSHNLNFLPKFEES